jgi:hypothetical protein
MQAKAVKQIAANDAICTEGFIPAEQAKNVAG